MEVHFHHYLGMVKFSLFLLHFCLKTNQKIWSISWKVLPILLKDLAKLFKKSIKFFDCFLNKNEAKKVKILSFPDNDENEPPYDKILLLN